MKSLQSVALTLSSKGFLVSIHVDRGWRYTCSRLVQRPVYRVAVNPPNGGSFDWDIRTFEFPWEAEDWLKEKILQSA